jgi:formylglycine-generating enzyme required for sulfatase activity
MTNCGTGNESCCTSLPVSGGNYARTAVWGGDTCPVGWAALTSVSGFQLDKYLVTVGRFRQFVNGGAGHLPAAGSGKHTHLNGGSGLNVAGGGFEPGWATADNGNIAPTNGNLVSCSPYSTWTNTPADGQENLPINCVNWWEAYAFCIWDGGFLPSEAEWGYAAAGGAAQRCWPWASPGLFEQWPYACPGDGCDYAIYGCFYPSGSGICEGVKNIAPVGTATLGAARWGQLDLVGNMWEWNLDFYAKWSACTDCANLTPGSSRAIRGGSFLYGLSPLDPYQRSASTPTTRDLIGFRCARAP